jgi:hypothetical protein
MATQPEYSAAANPILVVLDDWIKQYVPTTFGYQAKALAAMPALAGQCAKAGVDGVDTYRENQKVQQS